MSDVHLEGVRSDGLAVHQARFPRGCHTILSDAACPATGIVSLVAGAVRPQAGQVLVAGRSPAKHPRLRARIGAVTENPAFPEAPTVLALLETIDKLRAFSVLWPTWLAAWGLDSWLQRSTDALSREERRALALLVALSTRQPAAIVVHEPFCGIALPDPDVVAARLEEVAREAPVLITVANAADALRCSGHKWVLRPGRIEPLRADALTPYRHGGPVTMRVRCERPRQLLRGLVSRDELLSVAWNANVGDDSVWVHGKDAVHLASAVLRVARESGALLLSWELVPPTRAAVLAAHDGWIQGYHQRAWYAAQEGTPWSKDTSMPSTSTQPSGDVGRRQGDGA